MEKRFENVSLYFEIDVRPFEYLTVEYDSTSALGEDEKLQEEVLGKISLEHDILQQVAEPGKVLEITVRPHVIWGQMRSFESFYALKVPLYSYFLFYIVV